MFFERLVGEFAALRSEDSPRPKLVTFSVYLDKPVSIPIMNEPGHWTGNTDLALIA